MTPKAVRGFSLISAIFLLVALSGLAVFLATMSSVQHATVQLSLQGERAHFAAMSGIEWALHQIVNLGGAGLDCTPGTVSFALTDASLNGFAVSLSCSSQPVTEGARNYTLYSLTAIGSRGALGSYGHVSRTILATVAM